MDGKAKPRIWCEMALLCVVSGLWLVTWTETQAKFGGKSPSGNRYVEQWRCIQETRGVVFDNEVEARVEAAAKKADGFENVKVWKAESAEVKK